MPQACLSKAHLRSAEPNPVAVSGGSTPPFVPQDCAPPVEDPVLRRQCIQRQMLSHVINHSPPKFLALIDELGRLGESAHFVQVRRSNASLVLGPAFA